MEPDWATQEWNASIGVVTGQGSYKAKGGKNSRLLLPLGGPPCGHNRVPMLGLQRRRLHKLHNITYFVLVTQSASK